MGAVEGFSPDFPTTFPTTVYHNQTVVAEDAKISFAKMQAGDYDEEAAQKKLEAAVWAMTTSAACEGCEGVHGSNV